MSLSKGSTGSADEEPGLETISGSDTQAKPSFSKPWLFLFNEVQKPIETQTRTSSSPDTSSLVPGQALGKAEDKAYLGAGNFTCLLLGFLPPANVTFVMGFPSACHDIAFSSSLEITSGL